MLELALSLFIKYGLPLLLRKEVVTQAEALAISAWYWARTNIKTTPSYPQTPGQAAAEQLPPGTTNTNMSVGKKPENNDFPAEAKSGL